MTGASPPEMVGFRRDDPSSPVYYSFPSPEIAHGPRPVIDKNPWDLGLEKVRDGRNSRMGDGLTPVGSVARVCPLPCTRSFGVI